jgi:hypothetical protein
MILRVEYFCGLSERIRHFYLHQVAIEGQVTGGQVRQGLKAGQGDRAGRIHQRRANTIPAATGPASAFPAQVLSGIVRRIDSNPPDCDAQA